MVLPWDALVLSSSVEEAFSASVVSGDHARVHCRFPGSCKINPISHILVLLNTIIVEILL